MGNGEHSSRQRFGKEHPAACFPPERELARDSGQADAERSEPRLERLEEVHALTAQAVMNLTPPRILSRTILPFLHR